MSRLLWFRSMALCIILLVALPLPAMSQKNMGTATEQENQQKRFSQEELAQLLAPIALYPDELISQVLMASTYPLEVVAADRWVAKNPELKGDALASALEEQEWDPSVKSLVNFPTVLSMMSQKLEITSKLGDAFLAQEADVMDTVQMLRRKAMDAGNLKSSNEQQVVVEEETVTIQPATREVIYIPAYDPLYVYGPWFYPGYPPYPYYYYPPPAYGYFGFAGAFTIGLAWGYAWGGCNWHNHTVYVDVYRHRHISNRHINHNRYISYYERRRVTGPDGRGTWRHDPSHRRGVAYRDIRTAERFGQSPARVSRSRAARGFDAGPTAGKVKNGARRSPGGINGRPGIVPGGKGSSSAPARRSEGRPAGIGRSKPATGGIVAPRRDTVPGGVFRDGASARSASERGRSSREFSRGGGGVGPGNAGRPATSGGSSGGGRPGTPGDGRGGGSRH